jgi:hypothetical protein
MKRFMDWLASWFVAPDEDGDLPAYLDPTNDEHMD